MATPVYNPAHNADAVLASDRSGGACFRRWYYDRVRASGVPAGTGRLLARCRRLPAVRDRAQSHGAADVIRPAYVGPSKLGPYR